MNRSDSPPDHSAPMVGSDLPDACFEALCALLKRERGFDLAQYKDRCAKRRVAKRMRAVRINQPEEYLQKVLTDRGELDALLGVLTIHVSQFFRNPSTFRILERSVLPPLLERAGKSDRPELRIWSVGCAGGEEPYSLALLFAEQETRHVRISILGTDINEAVLNQARLGVYPASRLAEVPSEVVNRYFLPEGGDFRLCDKIRRQVEFRRHDVLAAEDYPCADLILCRNVLIYFSREEQARILQRFSGTLSEGGILVLGRAETLLGESRKMFAVESAAERIYRRKSN